MCNRACLKFARDRILPQDVCGLKVLEVGSRNVNGSARSIVEPYGPQEYVGIDIQMGPGVDRVLNIENIDRITQAGQFHLVICTEVLEHIAAWRMAINQLKLPLLV